MDFGLIGCPLEHSLSQKYFCEKFGKLGLLDNKYSLFEIKKIEEIIPIIEKTPTLKGLNVTSPYKQQICNFLDEIDREISKLRIINVVDIIKKNNKNYLKGYNSDIYGIKKTLKEYLSKKYTKVLILGSGSSSLSCRFILEKFNIEYLVISRNPIDNNYLKYDEITKQTVEHHNIIINTTTLGIYPEIDNYPKIPYQFLTKNHICFDLIYNPKETKFLKLCSEYGAKIINGEEMFIEQAEKSWEIWNRKQT
ncbi:MAG: shikimate dehydrogenase [Bacteroidales bacterium]|jgi:shikimate dehydrogenase|nr:shikimate dehydrogenase [Bacteroidales bacterium]